MVMLFFILDLLQQARLDETTSNEVRRTTILEGAFYKSPVAKKEETPGEKGTP